MYYVVIYPGNDRKYIGVEEVPDGQQPRWDRAYSTDFDNRKQADECAIWQVQTRGLTYK